MKSAHPGVVPWAYCPSATCPESATSYITVINLFIVALIYGGITFPLSISFPPPEGAFFRLWGESQLQRCALHPGEVAVNRRGTPLAGHICFPAVAEFYTRLSGAKSYVPSANKQTGEHETEAILAGCQSRVRKDTKNSDRQRGLRSAFGNHFVFPWVSCRWRISDTIQFERHIGWDTLPDQ